MIGHAMPNASKLRGQAAETEPQRASRLQLYGSLAPSRSFPPFVCLTSDFHLDRARFAGRDGA